MDVDPEMVMVELPLTDILELHEDLFGLDELDDADEQINRILDAFEDEAET